MPSYVTEYDYAVEGHWKCSAGERTCSCKRSNNPRVHTASKVRRFLL